MAFDEHANFGATTVATAPSPADSGTTLKVAPGTGVVLPSVDPFNVTVAATGVQIDRTNAEVVTMSAVARTTVASGSNAAVLPQATIHVASSSDFNSGGGTFGIVTTDGIVQVIAYTGKGSGTLTGCTGGTGTMHTSDPVVGDDFTIVRTAEAGENGIVISRSIVIGDQVQATITKKHLTDIEGFLNGTLGLLSTNAGAPSTFTTPLVFDTTLVTGGLYGWDGSSYVQIGDPL